MRRLALLILLLAWPVLAGATELRGRVMDGELPLAGMRVAAYPGLDFSGTPLAVAEPSDADGGFHLELAPGYYGLFARSADGSRFAFCGRNPLAVGDAPVWAGLQAVPVSPVQRQAYADDYSGAIEGRVLADGRPLAGAYVHLYLDAAEDLKGQGYRLSPPTDAEGRFAFDGLPESGYFLVARKRADGNRVGPVLEGDWLGVYPGNPLAVQAGSSLRVELPVVQKLRAEAGSETFSRASGPTLHGQVVDAAGRPVAGVHVFAYTERVIGHQRPAALSSPTGSDGRFLVNLRRPGTYYVGARQEYGDSPAPGELFGLYDGSADHGLTVPAEGYPAAIRIVVEPIDLQ